MKEQAIDTELQRNEEEIGKPAAEEFRKMIVKMINSLENKRKKVQESMKKPLNQLKNKLTETNNTIT